MEVAFCMYLFIPGPLNPIIDRIIFILRFWDSRFWKTMYVEEILIAGRN